MNEKSRGAQAVLYLDESGHSGRNYLDLEQPFYVLAGWLVGAEWDDSCRKAVLTWEDGVRQQGQKEIKAKAILGRTGGFDKVLGLCSSLLATGAVPVCCIFEKRFGVCMNIAEAFFGVLDQDDQDFLSSRDALERNALAGALSSCLSDAALVVFGRAVMERDTEALRSAAKSLRDELVEGAAPALGFGIDLMPIEIAAEYLFRGDNAENSINATVFQTMVMLGEHAARAKTLDSWAIVHDETPHLAQSLIEASEALRSQPEGAFRQNNGLTLYSGALRFSALSFHSSADDALIRAADQLSSLLYSFFAKRGFRHPEQKLANLFDARPSHALSFLTLAPETERAFTQWLRSSRG